MEHNNTRGSIGVQNKFRGFVSLGLSLLLGLLGIALVCLGLDIGRPVSASPIALAAYAALDEPPIVFTKTVQPLNPDTGGEIEICITVSGHEEQVLDLVLAQDVSPSMGYPEEGPTALDVSKEAAGTIVSTLPSQDRIAVVSYSKSATLEHELTADRAAISATIDGLSLGQGGTNIGEAIQASRIELTDTPAPNALKTIILLSDGVATCNWQRVCSNDPEVRQAARYYATYQAELAAEADIRIYTIGYGEEIDAELMQEIATLGNGEFYQAPDKETLKTIYRTIVDQLHSLTVTDVLTPGLETDCGQLPGAGCTVGASGATTVTWTITDTGQIPDPHPFCLSATVNLDPNYYGKSNLPGSQGCYTRSDGEQVCTPLDTPFLSVGGRKISGQVFEDLDEDGVQGASEPDLPGVRVYSDTGWEAYTDAEGAYLWRTSRTPALTLSVELPTGYTATTPLSWQVPEKADVYTFDFGLYDLPPEVYHLYLPAVAGIPPSMDNGGFERGWEGWSHGGVLKTTITSADAAEGAFSALLGDPTYKCEGGVPIGTGWVERTIDVPPASAPRLAFRFRLLTQDTNPDGAYDGFIVKIDGKEVFRKERTRDEYGCTPDKLKDFGWQVVVLDLSDYKGQQVPLRFEVRNGHDHWYNTWAYLDAVRYVH